MQHTDPLKESHLENRQGREILGEENRGKEIWEREIQGKIEHLLQQLEEIILPGRKKI